MKKINTIKKYREFKEILDLRHFKRNDYFSIYFRKNELNKTRIGILVSKKRNGIAVRRNKIKRQVRNILDELLDYNLAYDLIVIIDRRYDPTNFIEVKSMLSKLINSIIGVSNEKK